MPLARFKTCTRVRGVTGDIPSAHPVRPLRVRFAQDLCSHHPYTPPPSPTSAREISSMTAFTGPSTHAPTMRSPLKSDADVPSYGAKSAFRSLAKATDTTTNPVPGSTRTCSSTGNCFARVFGLFRGCIDVVDKDAALGGAIHAEDGFVA